MVHDKTQTMRAMRVKNTGFTTFDAAAPDQHDHNEVNPVAVRAFWGGPANTTRCVNAELVRFNEPLRDRLDFGKQLTEIRK